MRKTKILKKIKNAKTQQLIAASKIGDFEQVKKLCFLGADFYSNKNTVFENLINKGSWEAIEFLSDYGYHWDDLDRHWRTAVKNGDLDKMGKMIAPCGFIYQGIFPLPQISARDFFDVLRSEKWEKIIESLNSMIPPASILSGSCSDHSTFSTSAIETGSESCPRETEKFFLKSYKLLKTTRKDALKYINWDEIFWISATRQMSSILDTAIKEGANIRACLHVFSSYEITGYVFKFLTPLQQTIIWEKIKSRFEENLEMSLYFEEKLETGSYLYFIHPDDPFKVKCRVYKDQDEFYQIDDIPF